MIAPFLAWWLVPDEPIASTLTAQIGTLAREHGVAPFEPHITLATGAYVDDASARHTLQRMAAEANALDALVLQTHNVRHTAELFRCLYIAIEAHDGLTDLRGRARSTFTQSFDGVFEPHLSLLYERLPASERERCVAAAQPSAPRTLRCSTLSLILVHATADWTGDNFTILGSCQLRGLR